MPNKRPRHSKRKVRPDSMLGILREGAPIDPTVFRNAACAVLLALEGQIPVRDPKTMHVPIEMEKGKIEVIGFTDSAPYRMVMVLLEQFGPDLSDRQLTMLIMRVWAFMDIVSHPPAGLTAWVHRQDDNNLVHDAVFCAAASAPLNEEGQFEVASFLAEIRKVAGADQPPNEPDN